MAFDLRPRVVFHTSLGAVVVTVDPTTPLGGQVQIPGIGNVPYDIDVTGPTMIVHLPVYGDAIIPLIPSGGTTPLTIPGLGDVTYEVVFGPVDIPPEQMANVGAVFSLGTMVPYVLIGAAAFMFMRPKHNPKKPRKGRRTHSVKRMTQKELDEIIETFHQYPAFRELYEEMHGVPYPRSKRRHLRLIRGGKKNPCGNPMCCPYA